jgi:hypothetical protein
MYIFRHPVKNIIKTQIPLIIILSIDLPKSQAIQIVHLIIVTTIRYTHVNSKSTPPETTISPPWLHAYHTQKNM